VWQQGSAVKEGVVCIDEGCRITDAK